jgi:hypothetical protein
MCLSLRFHVQSLAAAQGMKAAAHAAPDVERSGRRHNGSCLEMSSSRVAGVHCVQRHKREMKCVPYHLEMVSLCVSLLRAIVCVVSTATQRGVEVQEADDKSPRSAANGPIRLCKGALLDG